VVGLEFGCYLCTPSQNPNDSFTRKTGSLSLFLSPPRSLSLVSDFWQLKQHQRTYSSETIK
jgi:hypothetical protein